MHFLSNQKRSQNRDCASNSGSGFFGITFFTFTTTLLDRCRAIYRQTRSVGILWCEHRELSRMQHEMIAFRIEEVDILFRAILRLHDIIQRFPAHFPRCLPRCTGYLCTCSALPSDIPPADASHIPVPTRTPHHHRFRSVLQVKLAKSVSLKNISPLYSDSFKFL